MDYVMIFMKWQIISSPPSKGREATDIFQFAVQLLSSSTAFLPTI